MLKYIAIVAVVIAGYFYLDKPKASSRNLPTTPPTRSVAVAPTPKPVPQPTIMPSAAPVPTPVVLDNKEKVYTYPEIQKMIVNDDVCALRKFIVESTAKAEAPVYIDALFEALNMDGYKQLFGVEGPTFKSQEGKTMTPTQKFIDALMTSQFFYGAKRDQTDTDKSLKQLEELSAAYPENAAYALYKLALEQQLGKNSSQVRSSAAQILKAKSYEPGLFDVRTELHKHIWTSPTIFYLTRLVASELPGVSFHKVRESLLSVDDSKTNEHLGNLMVQKGLASKRTFLSVEFDTTEYYYGNSLLNNKHPDAHELAESKEPGKILEVEDNWDHFELDHEVCDRSGLDEAYQKLKNRY